MNNFVSLGFLPRHMDLALLILRVWLGFALFIRHGLEKITNLSSMAAHFPNPVHIGAGPTFAIALFSDAVCSILVMLGFATRWAAIVIMINTGAAFIFIHRLAFFGPRNGELPWIYFGWALAIFIAGAGRYSFDGK